MPPWHAFCAAVTAPALAREHAAELPSWHIPGWTFTPVWCSAGYDSNVMAASGDAQAKAADQLFQMEPFGQIDFFSPRTTVNGGYHGLMRRYVDLSALDGTDHRAFLSLRERLSRRVTIFASENFAQVPTTDRLELVSGVPFQRIGARYNSAEGGVEARLTKSLDFTARYENTWVDFLDKSAVLTGGMVNGVRSSLSHRFDQRLSLGGEYQVRWADLNAGARHQLFQDAGAVVQYRASEATTLEAAGGLAPRRPHVWHHADGPLPPRRATHRAQRATSAPARRSYVPSVTFGGTNQNEEVHGYVQMPLTITASTCRNPPPGTAPIPSLRVAAPVRMGEQRARICAAALVPHRGVPLVYPSGHAVGRRPDRPERRRRAVRRRRTSEDSIREQQSFHPLDYMTVVHRRKWWFVVPVLVCIMVGAAAVAVWPKQYLSKAAIGVQSPTLSPELLRGVSSMDPVERQRAIQQLLLSPTVLDRVIREEKIKSSRPADEVAASLRDNLAKNIEVPMPIGLNGRPDPARGIDLFYLGFTDKDPARAQRIANRVASTFVEENSKVQTNRAENTADVLEQQLAASQGRLTDLENKLRTKKQNYIGRLPDQVGANVQMVNGARSQFESISMQIRSEQDHLTMVESQIDQMRQGSGAEA
jgi:capsular polysaccharide biosynthesis protein